MEREAKRKAKKEARKAPPKEEGPLIDVSANKADYINIGTKEDTTAVCWLRLFE